MPELAEVEVVRRNLNRWWVGRSARAICVVDKSLIDGDVGDFSDAFGARLDEVRRRGKYLSCHFATGEVVVFHFRMTGKIICSDVPEPDYARLSWQIDDVGWLVFKDQRRLGEARLLSGEEFQDYRPIQKMGPEPEDATVADIRDACTGRRLLKTALLDQSIVAGVGNIAVSEVLWRLELAPDIKCGELTTSDWERLIDELPQYFNELIEASMADEIDYIEEGASDLPFFAYGRRGEKCVRCGGEIKKDRIGSRSSYFCGTCQ